MHRTQMCTVCNRILDWVETPDGRAGYAHANEMFKPTHVPVPADLDAAIVEAHCDFCFAQPEQMFTVEAAEFEIPNPIDHRIKHTMSANWLACPFCADLIIHDRWKDLVKRVNDVHMATRPARGHLEEYARKKLIEELYGQLRPLVKRVRLSTPEDFVLDNPTE